MATGQIWGLFADVARNDLYCLLWRSTTDSTIVQPLCFQKLNGNNPVTVCTNLVGVRPKISEFTLVKRIIFAATMWLLITILKSELRSSNPFQHTRVPNEDRSSNCGRVTARIVRFNSVNSEIIWRKFTRLIAHAVGLWMVQPDLSMVTIIHSSRTTFLARSANLPTGLYVLPSVSFF